jgi:SH3-like domain-containing protein
MEEDVEIPNGEGWIHGSVIGVDTRNYGGQTLELLDSPINGNVVGEIKEQVYGLKLKDICGRWVQVDYKGIVGWIDSNWLCGNPLTTCS